MCKEWSQACSDETLPLHLSLQAADKGVHKPVLSCSLSQKDCLITDELTAWRLFTCRPSLPHFRTQGVGPQQQVALVLEEEASDSVRQFRRRAYMPLRPEDLPEVDRSYRSQAFSNLATTMLTSVQQHLGQLREAHQLRRRFSKLAQMLLATEVNIVVARFENAWLL